MKNNQRKSIGPKDARTSKGPNETAMGAIALGDQYANPAPGRKRKSITDSAALQILAHPARVAQAHVFPAQPAHLAPARVLLQKRGWLYTGVRFVSSDGCARAYRGKRARVLTMLATMAQGVTKWDCLPWHTRLGGTIHALRRDGLEISTELEGEYRHARYRLHTVGQLIEPQSYGRAGNGQAEDIAQ